MVGRPGIEPGKARLKVWSLNQSAYDPWKPERDLNPRILRLLRSAYILSRHLATFYSKRLPGNLSFTVEFADHASFARDVGDGFGEQVFIADEGARELG